MKIRSLLILLCVLGSSLCMTASADLVQEAKLVSRDGVALDVFGVSVAVSSDGNTALVGARGVNTNEGAAYVYTRSGSTWTFEQKLIASDGSSLDVFGWSVALSSDGNTALVGAYLADVGGTVMQGAAYVYTRSGTTWIQEAKLIASDGATLDWLGFSVALNGDGNTAFASAAMADVGTNVNQGAGYVFTRSGTNWTQQAKLTASDGAAADGFGFSVALNGDGDTAFASSYLADVAANDDQGAAYVFTRSGVTWTQQAKLIASDGAANDEFGFSVALNVNGDTAIAGSHWADVGGNADEGAAYVYTRSGTNWSEESKLIASDGAASNLFGVSVALSSNGNAAIVGAPLADVGGNMNQGMAYLFARSGTTWTQEQNLVSSDGAMNDLFGIYVALNGDETTALVGAYYADVGGNANQGAAYVFAVEQPHAVMNDFDGDGKSDLAVYYEASGYWFIILSGSGTLYYQKFGEPGYTPVPADFDGDGKADLTVFHEATGWWYYILSSTTTLGYTKLGEAGYTPVSADFDGDGKTDVAVYNESTGWWYYILSSTGSLGYTKLGETGYVPVPADYDGDGTSDLAVYNETTGWWYYILSSTGSLGYTKLGETGYAPVPADYDGDGTSDLAVYNETTGWWYYILSSTGSLGYAQLGGSGYTPVPGDYDGDGKSDLAVYQEASGYWFIILSGSGTTFSQKFGEPGYTPIR